MKREQCAACQCWDPSTAGLNKGEIGDCRRRPPVINSSLLAVSMRKHVPVQGAGDTEGEEAALYEASAFPMTHRDSWCAEFQWEPGEEPITGC